MPVLDSGEDASSGDYFIVMARADESLQDYVEARGAMSVERAAAILIDVANGVIEVGDLVHRDLKPQNILSHNGAWKIADFGIARFVEESTSIHTLKEYLSPHYAAPEQWRQEHATKATDVYALGCVAFCLVAGHPPFTSNPSDEHQHASVPQLPSTDPRFRSLVGMMLRKLPESRPSIERIRQLLEQINRAPIITAGTAVAELAKVGADVAEAQSREQAQLEEWRRTKQTRDSQAQEARERLDTIRENLWKAISDAAPAAQIKSQDETSIEYQLGEATLWMQVSGPQHAIQFGAFRRSGWDVITHSQLNVEQTKSALVWGASLWFARLPNTTDYRWYEVSCASVGISGGMMPWAETDIKAADEAIANTVLSGKIVVFGPAAIDDEDEPRFHERWMWLLAKAASGKLNYLETAPIRQWPPSLMS